MDTTTTKETVDRIYRMCKEAVREQKSAEQQAEQQAKETISKHLNFFLNEIEKELHKRVTKYNVTQFSMSIRKVPSPSRFRPKKTRAISYYECLALKQTLAKVLTQASVKAYCESSFGYGDWWVNIKFDFDKISKQRK